MRKRLLITDSKIMSEQQKVTLNGFFADMRHKIKEVNLLFRASEHGQSAQELHRRCDNKGSTVSIIKNDKGREFGAFVKIPWKSDGGNPEDKEAFMFSLNLNQKYPYHKGGAVYYYAGQFSFGDTGNEPGIGGNFNSKDCGWCSNNGNSFNIPGGAPTIVGIQPG